MASLQLSLSSQAALLRVLQEREVLPLGSSQPVGVDIQVVAATHHDLDALVARDQFRRDLLGRISGFMVRLPPLRQRREDLGLLLAALIWRAVPDRPDAVRLHPDAARALVRHEWPLNVRELEAALQVATALAGDQPIRVEHLPEAVRSAPRAAEGASAPGAPPLSPADLRRRDELIELLREHHGNVSAVARATGKARIQIQRWLRRYRLDPTAFRQ